MLFKCSTSMQRAVVAVVRPMTDMAEALLYLITLQPRKAWAVVRAWMTFIKWHGLLSKRRREVLRTKKVSNIYRGSIILRYLFGNRCFKKMM